MSTYFVEKKLNLKTTAKRKKCGVKYVIKINPIYKVTIYDYKIINRILQCKINKLYQTIIEKYFNEDDEAEGSSKLKGELDRLRNLILGKSKYLDINYIDSTLSKINVIEKELLSKRRMKSTKII